MRLFVTVLSALLVVLFGRPAIAADPLETELSGCSSPYCYIQLACDTTYTFDGTHSGAETVIQYLSYPLHINGCGDSTVIEWDADSAIAGHVLFQIQSTATGGVTFSNMKFVHREQNTSILTFTFYIFASDVTFDNITFESESGDVDTIVESVYSYGARLTVKNSRFLTEGIGVMMPSGCNSCQISGNRFRFNFKSGFTATNIGSVVKGTSDGVRIINNSFDLFTNADTNYYGIKLFDGSHTQVVGNTFVGFPPFSSVRGIELYRYNHALITGNTFIAGNRCSETIGTLCTIDDDCPGEETCEPATGADGIAFASAVSDKHDSFNVITGNMFNKFSIDDDACPIDFTGSHNGTTQGAYNTITDNHFGAAGGNIPPAMGVDPDDGICSLPGSTNILANNFTH